MEAVQGAVGLAPSKLAPRGLGTGQVESFSGYAARISARIAVPTIQFVRRVFQDAEGGGDLPLRGTVVAAARRLNVGERDSGVAAAVQRLTGHPDSGSAVVLRVPRPLRGGGAGPPRPSPAVVLGVLACGRRGAVRAQGLVAGARRRLPSARVPAGVAVPRLRPASADAAEGGSDSRLLVLRARLALIAGGSRAGAGR